jgi:hypothetical protein
MTAKHWDMCSSGWAEEEWLPLPGSEGQWKGFSEEVKRSVIYRMSSFPGIWRQGMKGGRYTRSK